VPIDAGLEELRQRVGAPGRYRLDAIDDRGHTIDKLPASSVIVPPRDGDELPSVPERSFESGGGLLAEAMRLNTELAKSIVDRRSVPRDDARCRRAASRRGWREPGWCARSRRGPRARIIARSAKLPRPHRRHAGF